MAIELAEIARSRARLTGKVIYLEDYFEKDEVKHELNLLAGKFVKDIGIDDSDTEISAATIVLAHNLKLKVVVEGVETQMQREFLRNHKCDRLQGYLLANLYLHRK